MEDDKRNVREHQALKEISVEKIVFNMLSKCKIEAVKDLLHIPLEDFEDRVSYYSGIPKSILKEIQIEETTPHIISFDHNTHLIILKRLCEFYKCKQSPTFRRLYDHLRKSNVIPLTTNFDVFRDIITTLGIDYQKISNNTRLLMEDPSITFGRCLYIKKMRKIRQTQKLIYYVSDKLIDSDTGYTFFHAICREGFTTGLFCINPTEDDFYKWVVDVLLETLKPSSVVILEKSAIITKIEPEPITMYDTKYDMVKWLTLRNVPCSTAMNKWELYELIKKYPVIKETTNIELIMRAHGHELLWLPSHFKGLSTIEPLWNVVENWKPNPIQNKLLVNLMDMPKIHFLKFEETIEQRENEIYILDSDIENILDSFLIHLKSNWEIL